MTTAQYLLSIGGLVAALWLVAYTVAFVLRDGHGMLSAHHRPPRSHHQELFEHRPAV